MTLEMEKTLVILKPSCVKRGLIGEVIRRFENKGLLLVGMKMMQLSSDLLDEHYSHLVGKSFFGMIKDSMMSTPVIVQCWEGINAVDVVRKMTGFTNGRDAEPGTIRGDYSMSIQENIIHASDSLHSAEVEMKRFFLDSEIFSISKENVKSLYSNEEIL